MSSGASNSQLKLCIDDLKDSISDMQETFSAMISENKTQSLILQVANRDSISSLWQAPIGELQQRHLRFWSKAMPFSVITTLLLRNSFWLTAEL